jgi:hypothetical protein
MVIPTETPEFSVGCVIGSDVWDFQRRLVSRDLPRPFGCGRIKRFSSPAKVLAHSQRASLFPAMSPSDQRPARPDL